MESKNTTRELLERDVEAYLVKLVKQEGGVPIKLLAAHMNGIPDRLIVLKDVAPFFVELKRPNGNLRKLQGVVATLLRSLGANVYKINTKADAYELITSLRRS